jgi:hypothetical protein
MLPLHPVAMFNLHRTHLCPVQACRSWEMLARGSAEYDFMSNIHQLGETGMLQCENSQFSKIWISVNMVWGKSPDRIVS